MPEGEEVKSLILLTCDSVCDVMMWLELGTRFREMSQCLQKSPTRAVSFLKAPTSTFTINNLLRHYGVERTIFTH